jgi:hypothetical protein
VVQGVKGWYGVWGPHSLHTAEATGSKPPTHRFWFALYTTEKELRASADTVAAWKEELIPQAGGKVVSVDEYEVIAEDPGRG